jgi:hypothetical protein
MSTTDLDTTPAPAAADPELKTYRGKTLEELLPRIREELGPDALVVRQRDGLMGGIGGFFQQQFVEVDAKPGHPRIDVYDEPPAAEPPAAAPSVADGFAGLLAAAAAEAEFEALAPPPMEPPAVEPPAAEPQIIEPPAPDLLAALEPPVADALPTPVPAPVPVPPKPAARRKPAAKRKPAPKAIASSPDPADDLVVALVAHGLGEQLAARLVADALVHELPFVPRGDRRIAVRRALAHRIPLVPARRAAGSAVAFVGAGGAGKTRCAAGLATAYARTGQAPVLCLALAPEDGGAALRRLLEPTGVELEVVATTAAVRARIERAPADAVVVIDTPAVAPGDAAAIAAFAAQLAPLGLDEVQLVVPATIAAAAAAELQERLAPLQPSGITLSHADATSQLGTVVELACSTRLPLAYVAAREQFAPVDPHAIAERLLP